MVDPILGLLTAVVSGGLIAGLIQIYKARPERDSVIVTATQTATTILQGLNSQLHIELNAEREKCSRLRAQLQAAIEQLRKLGSNWNPDLYEIKESNDQ